LYIDIIVGLTVLSFLFVTVYTAINRRKFSHAMESKLMLQSKSGRKYIFTSVLVNITRLDILLH